MGMAMEKTDDGYLHGIQREGVDSGYYVVDGNFL